MTKTTNNWIKALEIARARQRRQELERIKNATIFWMIMASPFALLAWSVRRTLKSK